MIKKSDEEIMLKRISKVNGVHSNVSNRNYLQLNHFNKEKTNFMKNKSSIKISLELFCFQSNQ